MLFMSQGNSRNGNWVKPSMLELLESLEAIQHMLNLPKGVEQNASRPCIQTSYCFLL
jgi:hypothetical protein